MRKLVVFDVDGTLNRTDIVSVPAHLKALKKRGITNVTEEQIRSTFGERAEEFVKILLGEVTPSEARAYLDDLSQYERELMPILGRPFDGVTETLRRLKEDGYRIATCSNSSLRYQTTVLNTLHLSAYVDTIQDLRPGMTKVETLALLLEKEKPDAAIMVGDRIFDIEAGRKNGLKTIGCRYGYSPLEAEKADYVVNHAAAIYQIVKKAI